MARDLHLATVPARRLRRGSSTDRFTAGVGMELGEDAWVDHVPGWCRGADLLFAELMQNTPWRGREVPDV